MRVLAFTAAAALAAALPSVAFADIKLVDASSIQGDNVLFNSGVQTGAMVTGQTQSGTAVNFMGTTVGGGQTIRANGGQARIEGSLNEGTNNPNDTNLLQTLNFGLANGGTFNNLEFNLFNGGQTTGTVSFLITDNGGQVFSFNDLALGAGENFFGFVGVQGQSIANVAFTTTAGIGDVRQIRLDQMGMVPEPATWAMLLLGFGAVGTQIRRRRRRTRVTFA